MTEEEKTQAYQAAADWVSNTFPNGEERYPHWPMIEAALEAAEKVREQESVNNAARYKDDMSFIKRWVQRVHDKETTLEEFYGVLRYYEPLKPVIKED